MSQQDRSSSFTASSLLLTVLGACGGCKSQPMGPATFTEFATRAPAAVCQTFARCKNQRVQAAAFLTTMGFLTFAVDDPGRKARLTFDKPVWAAEGRALPNQTECVAVIEVAGQSLGFDPGVIAPRVGTTITYDPARAGACLAALSADPPACAEDVKLDPTTDRPVLNSETKTLERAVEQAALACRGVVVGRVERGDSCAVDAECSEPQTRCLPAETRGAARTCQRVDR
jgi:hypothetical protein